MEPFLPPPPPSHNPDIVYKEHCPISIFTKTFSASAYNNQTNPGYKISSCLDLPMLYTRQLEVISCWAHLVALLQSLEASLRGNEAVGLARLKWVASRRFKKHPAKKWLLVDFL